MGQDVAILGAGIGGMAAAVALAQGGARVRVIEQAPALTEVGAGLQISPNGMVVLERLGVTSEGAVQSEGTELRDGRAGRLVLRLGPPAAGPTWYFHRADLLAQLASRAQALGVTVELGRQAVAVDAEAGQVTFADGSSETAQVFIGADGARGVSRGAINGAARPRFTGQVAWRALVPGQGEQAVAQLWMGPGRHVVIYPLRGGALLNIVAVEERRDWTEESWRREGDPDELRARFAGFGGVVRSALARVETAHLWALHLHPVAERWYRGRAALLGDAAHPTLPFLAQGACLALEDAWTLAACLGNGSGFARYEALRKDRAKAVVAEAGRNAWRFHLRAPMRQVAQLVLRLGGARVAPDFAWVHGYDVTEAAQSFP
ncbi:FAD-dependent monooxygenase [Seohaeicola nanhaiensis]|uniref:FAD-dependent monooxygenase n=1 Tax=Seohaeicola nanhaiensis TaxID=1387282 RepID=A0ABV9KE89_9RHOB